MLPHYHWGVIAGTYMPQQQVWMESVEISVIARDEAGAIKKAKELVTKPGYMIRNCIECFKPCEPRSIEMWRKLAKPLNPWENLYDDSTPTP